MSTRQQRWAQEVFECLNRYAEEAERDDSRAEFASKYRSLSRKLPTLLQQSGLIQGMIFARTRQYKASGVEEKYGDQLIRDLARIYSASDAQGLINIVQTAPMQEYLRLSEELIALAVWFRRYATVLLKARGDDQ